MERSQINLEKFLEEDIIRFLDSKITESNEHMKSTVNEQVEKAIKNKNVDELLTIFENLTNKYNSVDKNNVYKNILYEDILSIFETIKTNSSKLDNNSDLMKLIGEISKSKEIREGELPDTITAFQKIKMERAKKKLGEEELEYKKQSELEKQRQKISKELFVYIRKKHLTDSINKYHELKSVFEKYPARFNSEKEEFYNDILSFYMQIKKLKEELQGFQKPIETKNNEIITKQESVKSNIIRDIVSEIKKDMEKKDFDDAKSKIIDLKHIASKIVNKGIRGILENKISEINHKLDFVKRTSEHEV